MAHRYRIGTLLLTALLATSALARAWAQPPQEPVDVSAVQPESVAVRAVLDSNPTTLAELVRAAKILADLDRPDKGREFLQMALGAKPTQQQLAALVERFGSSLLMDLAGRGGLAPEAKQLAKAALTAAQRTAEDPKRLAQLIKQLDDPAVNQRRTALAGLREAQSAAVGAMIDVLADPARAAEHQRVAAALAAMGSQAVGPMVAILEGAEPRLTVRAVRVLSTLDAKQAAIYLLRPYHLETTDPKVRAAAGAAIRRLAGRIPTRQVAVDMLSDRARAYFDGRQPVQGLMDGRVKLGRWDAAAKRYVVMDRSVEDASAAIAARLARDAYLLAKDDRQVRLLYLATMLEAAVYQSGLDKPLPTGEGTPAATAAGFGAAVVEDLLRYAMAEKHAVAATAAARILGRIATAEPLLRQGAQPTVLVRAARHPDRRLRMAATDAIVRLQPAGPFPGSSYVGESLAFFAASGGVRRALLAGPSIEEARRFAGKLAELGFEVDTASTGREVMRLATASPDYELAMIDVTIEGPTADLLVQRIRRDCRTADLRVGLIARSGFLRRARQIADRDPMVAAFSRPHTNESIGWQVEQLATLSARTFVGHAERQHQAAEALARLAELAASNQRIYDMRRLQASVMTALHAPRLSAKAAAVLANVNSAESQRALTNLASRWTQPIGVRATATQAFQRNTQRHGILLTSAEIGRQYDRYNASEDLDADTQKILGLILDCIEAPTMPVKSEKEGEGE